ncbi:hypothetical protein K466DRAFT_548786 [Polyporus arcularius HHB13444]|uniref:Uncharacterized protein n=1 Tax=Polyporus arcularius HHB13444 TaxID=1314778 RepID=A0A5C3PGV2_9APHY|nr:hypothetical protein K466DRAFT_548786 [Polyporus arcularius HHB13444]
MGFILLTLCSDSDSRLSALEGFHFSTGVLASSVAEMLQAFILRFSLTMNITHLTMDYAEEFFGSSSGLAEAFAALKTIKYVKIHDVGTHGVLFLQKTRSCFVSADLAMAAVLEQHPRNLQPPSSAGRRLTVRNPFILLHGAQNDLAALTASGCRTLHPDDGKHCQAYPNVRDLDLQDNDLPVTTHYAHAFPNLSKLRVETSPGILSALTVSETDSVTKHRSRNRAQQLKTGTWKALDACHAPLLDHFMLCLICSVKEMHVFGPYMNPDMLYQVLKTTRPSALSLRGFFLADLATRRFAKLLRQPCAVDLKHLELFICIKSGDVDVAWNLDKVLLALRPLKIASFCLSISCFFPQRRQKHASSGEEETNASREYLKDLRLDVLASRIQDDVPSLETVSITLEGHPNRPRAMIALGAGPE